MRAATIRKLSPEARKLARMVNELSSLKRRLSNFVETVSDLELKAAAFDHEHKEDQLNQALQDLGDAIDASRL